MRFGFISSLMYNSNSVVLNFSKLKVEELRDKISGMLVMISGGGPSDVSWNSPMNSPDDAYSRRAAPKIPLRLSFSPRSYLPIEAFVESSCNFSARRRLNVFAAMFTLSESFGSSHELVTFDGKKPRALPRSILPLVTSCSPIPPAPGYDCKGARETG